VKRNVRLLRVPGIALILSAYRLTQTVPGANLSGYFERLLMRGIGSRERSVEAILRGDLL
jgi:hypothetical protein